MKILITGANGYIGAKLVKVLCDKGVDVIASDIDSPHIDKRATFIKANIFEAKENWYAFFGKPDVCLHMAWRDGFVHNSEKHMGDLSAHFLFMKNLIDNGLPKIASMGSMHEVGYWEGAIDENTPCSPLSQYGIAKNALRKSIELYARQKNCKFQWLRCFYIYGDDKYGNSIFCKIRQAVEEGKAFFPFTSGKNKYDFIHVDELSEQLAMCLMQDEVLGVINCCTGKPVSLAEQVEWYIEHNRLPIKLDYGKYPDRPYDSPCIYGDDSKIKRIMSLAHFKVLVTGVAGQLGHDVINELKKKGLIAIGTDIYPETDLVDKANWDEYVQLDITNDDMVRDAIGRVKPNAIIHCAAWTNVDGAEDMNHRPLVERINVFGTNNLVQEAKKHGSKFIYISTDYVFNGEGETPWQPDDHNYSPLNYYGETKLKGELAVSTQLSNYYIVRISWAFGKGKNFIKTMLSLADKGYKELKVVDDQIGTPTYTYDLARLLVDMVQTDKYGYYHATNEGGFISWADFAEEIFKQAKKDVIINRVTTSEYGVSVAKRPYNSRLDKTKLIDNGFVPLPDWRDALKRYLEELGY